MYSSASLVLYMDPLLYCPCPRTRGHGPRRSLRTSSCSSVTPPSQILPTGLSDTGVPTGPHRNPSDLKSVLGPFSSPLQVNLKGKGALDMQTIVVPRPYGSHWCAATVPSTTSDSVVGSTGSTHLPPHSDCGGRDLWTGV